MSWNRSMLNGKNSGFIASSIAPGSNPHRFSIRARSIGARSIDFDIVRDWMRFCIEGHTKQCLIDCEQQRIVQSLPSAKYSALSYIWGTNGFGNNDRSIHSELPTTLPKTIEDALKVTKELGLRYICIDRYCINQDDDVEKQIQIQQMDLIYQNAFITIVAAIGSDLHFGLPGIGTSRNVQHTAWIKETCLTVANFANIQFFHLFNIICNYLSAYSGTELFVEADRIGAFEGMFNNFKRKKFPVRQFLGVPIMPAAIGGPQGGPKPAQRSRSESFAAGLSWRNSTSGIRRTQFPTWSWIWMSTMTRSWRWN
ncbi:heterokaryon incompatibility protein-domain-containing protein [Bipolaris maydis]|nr:heterokaryon incompatibility protein-domain-containing protein [Bipolaris maydis]